MNVSRYEQFEITGVKVRHSCVYPMAPVIIENGDQFELNEIELTNSHTDQKLPFLTECKQNHTLPKNENAETTKSKIKRKSTETINLYRKKIKVRDIKSEVEKHDDKQKEQQRVFAFKKYTLDENYKKEKISASQLKYKTNLLFQANVKDESIRKYKMNDNHRAKVKKYSFEQYKTSETH